MALMSFKQWLSEDGKRTSLGIYPPAYGTSSYPPLYFAPISATHANAFATTHKNVHPELLKKNKKSEDKLKKLGL